MYEWGRNKRRTASEKEVGEVSVNLKALIGRQSYYQVIRGKNIENYLQISKVDTTVDRKIQRRLSRNGQDKNFAPKQNERDCPMTSY